MIRLARHQDLLDIKKLWEICFFDSDEYIDFFIKNCWNPQNAIIYEDEKSKEIVSMLFLLTGEININTQKIPAGYIYCACTLPSFRGQGIMRKLLSYAESFSLAHNISFLALKPGEASLFSFYKKFDYLELFQYFLIKISRFELKKLQIQNTSKTLKPNFSLLEKLRTKTFSPCFSWDKNAIQYAFNEAKNFNGGYIIVGENEISGYALYHKKENELNIAEIIYTNQTSLFSIFQELLKIPNIQKYSFECHSIIPELIKGETTKQNAMIKPLTSFAKTLLSQTTKPFYLGLTLD